MKLRISGDSIRLRLSITEVETLVSKGSVCAACTIGDGLLRYQLNSDDNRSGLAVTFSEGIINVYVPTDLLVEWDKDDRVGFDGHDTNGIYILIEKDFQCMKPRPQEDESDLYTNPQSRDTSHG